jgi:8-oxo-dGTP pyrophosphatase MutT (NUDIX family)
MLGQSGPHTRQAAVIPLVRSTSSGVRICLIRRRDRDDWGIPKGFIDPGDTALEAAITEAYEEAGVTGQVIGQTLGSYSYGKRGTTFVVAVFLMEVVAEEATWPEMRWRQRRWCTLDEAVTLLKAHPVLPLLSEARAKILNVQPGD